MFGGVCLVIVACGAYFALHGHGQRGHSVCVHLARACVQLARVCLFRLSRAISPEWVDPHALAECDGLADVAVFARTSRTGCVWRVLKTCLGSLFISFLPVNFVFCLVCAFQTAILALQSVVGSDLKPKEIEVAVVTADHRKCVDCPQYSECAAPLCARVYMCMCVVCAMCSDMLSL